MNDVPRMFELVSKAHSVIKKSNDIPGEVSEMLWEVKLRLHNHFAEVGEMVRYQIADIGKMLEAYAPGTYFGVYDGEKILVEVNEPDGAYRVCLNNEMSDCGSLMDDQIDFRKLTVIDI